MIERFLAPMDSSTQQAESSDLPAVTSSLPQAEHATEARLTRREQEILRLVAMGATNREVAQRLIITEGTVKNHLAHLFSRLGLRDRTQAVIYACEHVLF